MKSRNKKQVIKFLFIYLGILFLGTILYKIVPMRDVGKVTWNDIFHDFPLSMFFALVCTFSYLWYYPLNSKNKKEK